MAKKFYAVQIGNDYSSDIGSTIKRDALRMAKQEARRNPGKEVTDKGRRPEKALSHKAEHQCQAEGNDECGNKRQ